METLELSIGLRVSRTAKADPNSQSNQPDTQLCNFSWIAWRTPGRAVINVDTSRQAIALENLNHLLLHRGSPFVVTSLNGQAEPRVVVQQGQGVAPTLLQREMPFEIHLPKIIRRVVFKPQRRRLFFLRQLNQAMPAQDIGNGTWSDTPFQQAANGASAPCWMGLPKGDDLCFQSGRGQFGAGRWSAGFFLQTRLALRFVAFDPLVRCLRADTESSAQLTFIAAGLPC